jgi:NAD(P)-dependent dehydrogenase (short-subunit alcohol dehydrogenase family)
MSQKICVITGASAGIGKETAIALATEDYRVVILNRPGEKSKGAVREIKDRSGSDAIEMHGVDLSSQASIREVAETLNTTLSHIDVLINNAGVIKRNAELSADGIEMTYAVNVVAPFLLTDLLLPLLKKSPEARIINLSSELYKNGKPDFFEGLPPGKFNGNALYANSKWMVVHNTQSLAAQLKDTPITVNSLHPGVIGTDVFREYPKWIGRLLNLFIPKPDVGAKPSIYLATSPDVANITGKYFNKFTQKEVIESAGSTELGEQVWHYSMQLVTPQDASGK